MKYIMGIGNYSMLDDSIGIRVVEYIAENNLDQGFRALDMSGNLINILNYFNNDTEKIIIIDAVKLGLKSGEYKFFNPKLSVSNKSIAGISTHEGDLIKILELARTMNYYQPEICIMGIEPKSMINEFGLSEELNSNLENYVKTVIKELNS